MTKTKTAKLFFQVQMYHGGSPMHGLAGAWCGYGPVAGSQAEAAAQMAALQARYADSQFRIASGTDKAALRRG